MQPAQPPVGTEPLTACAQALADLRAAGATRLDPLGMHYLDVLATRAAAQQGRVRAVLEARLQRAVAALRARVEQSEATTATASAVAPSPLGEPNTLGMQAACSPLAALNRYLAEHAQEADPGIGASLSTRPELKAARQFRATWAQMSANQQLKHALSQAPQNAGPINSHMLVLRSLALMRDISPDYLKRFMAYADALLCLDQPLMAQAGSAAAAAPKGAVKKARSPRAKAVAVPKAG